AIVVGVDDSDRHFRAHLHDKLADARELIRPQCELRIHLRTHRPIRVKPDVMRAAIDQLAQPLFAAEFVDIRLANAGRDAGEDALAEAVLKSTQRALRDFLFPAPLIADDLASFDADQRRDVAEFAQTFGDLL